MRPVLRFHKVFYWIVLATEEKALLALVPTRRIVPTTSTRITASITAYSAMSWPCSSRTNGGTFFISGHLLSHFNLLTAGSTRHPCQTCSPHAQRTVSVGFCLVNCDLQT